MLKLLIALVLLAHGIGHSLGLLQVFRIATVNPQWNGDSWLLTGPVGSAAAQAAGVVIWATAIVGFAALAAVVIGWLPATWWVPLAVGSAAVSLAGLALFPTAFPPASSVGALVVDVAVLASVLWLHWAPEQLAS